MVERTSSSGRQGRIKTGSAARFCVRSTARSLATVAGEYALIALIIAGTIWLNQFWVYPLAVVLIGTRQYALGECMTHEASHRNLSRQRWINEALGIVSTWPVFVTLSGYRRFHNKLHHGIDLDDPANSIREDYDDWGLPPEHVALTPAQARWHLIFKPISGMVGAGHLIKTIQDFYWDRDLVETWAMLGAWTAAAALLGYFGLLTGLVAYWIVPWLVVLPVLNYWSEVGDHYRVSGAETRSDLNWFLNTLVSHNIGYHALHHRYPGIPWFRLPAAYRAFKDELIEQTSTGYAMTFRQIVAADIPDEDHRDVVARHGEPNPAASTGVHRA